MDDSARPDDRRAKLARLREQGIDPFPHEFPGVVPIAAARRHDDLEPGEETDRAYRVAGRLAARRGQGGAAFIDLVDRAGSSSCTPSATCSARSPSTPSRRSTSAT